MNLKKRSEVATENTWDLSDLYESDAKWEEDFAALAKMLEPLLKLQGVLSESLNNLIHCFEIEDQIDRAITKVYTYAHLKSDQALGNADYQAMQDRIKSKYVEISSQLAWILPEILSIPDSTIMQYFNDPKLGVWKRLLENYMRRKAHTLSPEEERLLAMAAEPMSGASKTFSILSNADLAWFKFSLE